MVYFLLEIVKCSKFIKYYILIFCFNNGYFLETKGSQGAAASASLTDLLLIFRQKGTSWPGLAQIGIHYPTYGAAPTMLGPALWPKKLKSVMTVADTCAKCGAETFLPIKLSLFYILIKKNYSPLFVISGRMKKK